MLVYKKGRFLGDYLPRHGSLCTFALPLPNRFLDFAMSMVAFGDRKDFLQVLRMGHFRRKCPMRKTCRRDAGRGRASACTRLLPPQFEESQERKDE